MVVYVLHRDRRGWRGGDAMTSRNLVRLARSSVAATASAIPSSTSSISSGLSLSRAGGRRLCATSPPPSASIDSAACWESRTLRSDGEDGEDWEEVVAAGDADTAEEADEHGVVFGVAPTVDEVHTAISSIKQVFEKAPTVDSEAADLQALALPISMHPWTGPARLILNASALLPKEHQIVVDSLRLLHEDPFVQKMVMALSIDKAVWAAVQNNDVVKEFKRSFQDANGTDLNRSSTTPLGFMTWVLENTQAKIKEFLEKILGLVNMLFQAGNNNYDFSDDIVKMSFMLSVLVFIVVTIARIR